MPSDFPGMTDTFTTKENKTGVVYDAGNLKRVYAEHVNDLQDAVVATQDHILNGLNAVLIPFTIIDAKGDLIVGTAADTPAALTVGANGTFLKANSAQAAGVEWAALAAGDIGSGQLALARGGSAADLSATGPGFLKQAGVGSTVTVGAIAAGDLPTGIDATKIGGGTVNNLEFSYLANVTSDIQAQISALASSWPFVNLITVDSSGSGDHTTVAAAIAAANPGDTILVNSETFNEAVSITAAIHLILMPGTVLASATPGGTTLTMSGTGLRVSGGGRIEQTDTGQAVTVSGGGTATIADVTLDGATWDIQTGGGGTAYLDGTILENGTIQNNATLYGHWIDNAISEPIVPFQATNSSGATVNQGDIGYIDSAGAFQTTTTANNVVNWAVVVAGAINGGTCLCIRRGVYKVNYTSTAPDAGHYLVTSTTAGSAQRSTTMRPEIFAVCRGAGSGGKVLALLLCNTVPTPLSEPNDLIQLGSHSGTIFSALINGTPSGVSIVYDTVTGNENSIQPQASGELGKLVLHNITRGNSALISATNIGTNTITVTNSADISGWANNDQIWVNSSVNTDTSVGVNYFDVQITSGVPALARGVWVYGFARDSGGSTQVGFHPWETFALAKGFFYRSMVTNTAPGFVTFVPLINRKFTFHQTATGSATALAILRAIIAEVAAP